MPLTTQDFEKGLDFTALVTASGSQHNQLIELAIPKDDSGATVEGKGMILVTRDSAVGVPTVPDASVTTKWKRYIWARVAHTSVVSQTVTLYGWSDNATNDAVFKRWIAVAPTVAQFQAIVDAALAAAQAAQATANTAISTANAANTTASTALTTATNAETTANSVATTANNALATATTAQSAATLANSVANTANVTASTANTTANSALAAATANRNARYVCIVEQQNAGVGAGANVGGANVRQLNIERNDVGNLATVAAGIVTVNTGTYRVRAWSIGHNVTGHQLYLVKNSDNSTLIIGSTAKVNGVSINLTSELEGLIVLSAATAIRLDDYFSGTNANGLGDSLNIGPADKKEVYAMLELEKLD